MDRTFVIEPFQYDGIYQTSAAISPGSNGSPCVSKSNGKVFAINSARHTTEVNIGFSIPIYQIIDTVNQWVDSPLTQEEFISLFYYQTEYTTIRIIWITMGILRWNYNDDYIEYYEIPYEESWYDYFNYWSDDYEVGTETEENSSDDYSSDDNYYNEYDDYGTNDYSL